MSTHRFVYILNRPLLASVSCTLSIQCVPMQFFQTAELNSQLVIVSTCWLLSDWCVSDIVEGIEEKLILFPQLVGDLVQLALPLSRAI